METLVLARQWLCPKCAFSVLCSDLEKCPQFSQKDISSFTKLLLTKNCFVRLQKQQHRTTRLGFLWTIFSVWQKYRTKSGLVLPQSCVTVSHKIKSAEFAKSKHLSRNLQLLDFWLHLDVHRSFQVDSQFYSGQSSG